MEADAETVPDKDCLMGDAARDASDAYACLGAVRGPYVSESISGGWAQPEEDEEVEVHFSDHLAEGEYDVRSDVIRPRGAAEAPRPGVAMEVEARRRPGPDCPICLQSLEDQGRHCVCPCGTSFHGTCVATYVTSQAEQGGVVKCPSCASIWPEEVYSPCLGDQPELQQRFERAKKSQEELLSRSNGNDASPDPIAEPTAPVRAASVQMPVPAGPLTAPMTYMAPPVTMGPAPVTAVEVAAPVMMAPPVTQVQDRRNVSSPKRRLEYHTILREQATVEETLVEVPQVLQEEIIREVPVPRYSEVIKEIELPYFEARERIIEVPMQLIEESCVEVPRVERLEVIKEVPKAAARKVPKHVEKPIVLFPGTERLSMAFCFGVHSGRVEKPENHFVTKEVPVPLQEIHDNIIEEIPKVEVRYVEKTVEVPQIEWVERVVEVPQITYEECGRLRSETKGGARTCLGAGKHGRIVEVPQKEVREIVKQVPKPVVQYVDKKVPKHVMQYFEQVRDKICVLKQEVAVEVPEVQAVELITQVPKPQYEPVPKEIPLYQIQVQERVEQTPITLRQERAVPVEKIETLQVNRQVPKPMVEYVEKAVPRVETQAVEKEVEVPMVTRQEVIVEVPQVQVAEVIREMPKEMTQQIVKEVPKYQMEYVNKVLEALKPQRYESGSPMRSARTVAGASGYGPLLGSGRTVPVATEPSMGVGTAGRAVSYGMQSASSAISASSFRVARPPGSAMDAFSALDRNGDGVITREEWEAARADVQADGTSELSPRTKEALARLGIRPCPQCRVMIQKQADGLFTGCDKMTCRCGCMFCFRCGSEARAGGVARCRCVGPQHSYIPRSAVLSNYEGAWVFPSALDVDLTKRPKGRSKTTSARLQRESKALAKDRHDPPPLIRIAHEAGQLRWHFIMEGPLESAFEGGRYWGNLDMPQEPRQDYPFQPPLVRFRTPTGRFKVDTWLCRTQLDYHPEGWQPSWTLSGFLLALLALLCGLDDGVIDALGGRSHRAYTWILHMQHACWF
eukprot:g19174.t1